MIGTADNGNLIRRIDALEKKISDYRKLEENWKGTEAKLNKTETVLRRQNKYLEALHQTSLGLISRLDSDELMEAIIIRAGELVDAGNAFVFQYDSEKGDLVIRAGIGLYATLQDYRLKPGEGMAGKVWQTGRTLAIDDYRFWDGRNADSKFDQIKAAVGIPLKSGSKITGVIGLTRINSKRKFSDDEITVLGRLAALASIAQDNALLHAKLNQELVERNRGAIERKKLEEQFLQAQKMEAVGTLAGGIAHDFNNILMAMQGNVSLMMLKTDPDHPHYSKLKNFEKFIQSGSDLTRQLLGFARGGKYEVKTSNLNHLAQKTSRLFARTTKEINIQTNWQQDIWSVKVDRGQLEQVLLNIYVNSWQAMPEGGTLYIKTENMIVDEKYVRPYRLEPGRYVKISVTDTGIGMKEGVRQRIFDPFFTTKELSRGTGLGLASAYGIIKNHKGIINVYSEEGKGTTFNIYLPASNISVDKHEDMTKVMLSGSERVLFVDDEEMIIDVGQEILKELGYRVLPARSGEEAVALYRKHKDNIDIVILDMIMPDIPGRDVYKKLSEINTEVKVLLSSGYSLNGQATEILNQGCSGFIQKPFSMVELSQKIRKILDDR